MLGLGKQQPRTEVNPIPNTQQADYINSQPRELTVEFQKYITDTAYLKLSLFKALCGWEDVTHTSETELMGKPRYDTKKGYKVNWHTRTMNEAGANYCYGEIEPLISQTISTGFLEAMEIYNLWNGHLDSIRYDLLDSYYIDFKNPHFGEYYIDENGKEVMDKLEYIRNPYELNPHRIGNVMTLLAIFYPITSKAKRGFTLKELAESYQTATLMKFGQSEKQQGGFLDNIFKRGKG